MQLIVRGMDETAADRLKAAREDKRYESAKAAAEAMGVPVATYIQHENGTRGFPAERAKQYGRFFGVAPEWLLYGRRDDRGLARIIGKVGADPEGTVLFSTGQETGDLAPLPPGSTSGAVAVEVAGHSMRGLADDGALIFFEDQRTPPTPDMLGHVVVVELETGEVLVKRLLRGSKRGLFDLESIVGPTRNDARIVWAAHVTAVIPPYQAKRIIIRAGTRAA